MTDKATAPGHLALGQLGEKLAAEYLQSQGYRIVAANFKLPVGRNLRNVPIHAEIDLVAYERATLCFVEVKTRASDHYAAPEINVDLRKQRQITRAARVYRRLFGLQGCVFRYDVVSIIMHEKPKVTLLRNFWTEEKFRWRIREEYL